MVQQAQIRKLPWPEVTLIACGLIIVAFLMFTSAQEKCQTWRQDLSRVTGAFLAGAGEEEFPRPERNNQARNTSRERATSRLLDERPFGCL